MFSITSTVFNSDVILSGNNFFGNVRSPYNGCIFDLKKTNLTTFGHTEFSNITCKSGTF